jgi:hypothetical protein
MAQWLIRQEPKVEASAARTALGIDIATLVIVTLFFYLTKDLFHQYLGGFLAAHWYSLRV